MLGVRMGAGAATAGRVSTSTDKSATEEAATRIQPFYRGKRKDNGRGEDEFQRRHSGRRTSESSQEELYARLHCRHGVGGMSWRTTQSDFDAIRTELERLPSSWPPRVHKWRVSLYFMLEEPRSSWYAQAWSLVMILFILSSVLAFILETMHELDVAESTWDDLEVFCTLGFTAEYVLRLFVCGIAGKTLCRFIRSPMNMTDLFAILPFYVWVFIRRMQVAKAFGMLRAVRLVRLFRIFKLGRYSAGLQLMVLSLKNSSQALWVLSFFLCIGCVLFSSAVFYAEKMECPESKVLKETLLNDGSGRSQYDHYMEECRASIDERVSQTYGLCCDEYDSPLDFPSIIEAFWWCIVTMTTVGFGEVYPRTWLGKLVGTITMLSGILLIALPIAIIGRKFQEVYDDHVESTGQNCRSGPSSHLSFFGASIAVPDSADGPSLNEMARRLRLMRLPSPQLATLARELAEGLAEVSAVQKEIVATENAEAGKQMEAALHFDVILGQLCALCKQGGAHDTPRKRPKGNFMTTVTGLSQLFLVPARHADARERLNKADAKEALAKQDSKREKAVLMKMGKDKSAGSQECGATDDDRGEGGETGSGSAAPCHPCGSVSATLLPGGTMESFEDQVSHITGHSFVEASNAPKGHNSSAAAAASVNSTSLSIESPPHLGPEDSGEGSRCSNVT